MQNQKGSAGFQPASAGILPASERAAQHSLQGEPPKRVTPVGWKPTGAGWKPALPFSLLHGYG